MNDALLSAASRRALERGYDDKDSTWVVEFDVEPLEGDLAYEPGVVRRDPSSILWHSGRYHLWYTRSEGETLGFEGHEHGKVFPWDRAEVWYATSLDGLVWREEGRAIAPGPSGAFDDRSVFTPEVMHHGDRFVMVYQCVQSPYRNRSFECIAMASSPSPHGPWEKLPAPILEPTRDGIWRGKEDSRFLVEKRGSFDSHKVHDPCLLAYRGKFYLYYKGEMMGEGMNFGGREIKHGVAIADHIEGPYWRCPLNPISNSGHEVVVWPYREGIATLLTTDGPEKNTLQWAADGINFEIQSHIKGAPEAVGLYRDPESLNSDDPLEGIRWGLCHRYDASWQWNYICRFTSRRQILTADTYQNTA